MTTSPISSSNHFQLQMCMDIACGSDSAAKHPHILPSTDPQIVHPSDSSRDSSRNLRKRKKTDSEDGGPQWRPSNIDGDSPEEKSPIRSQEKKREVRMACIRPPSFVYPKTAYDGHVPSMPRYSEKSILQDILVG